MAVHPLERAAANAGVFGVGAFATDVVERLQGAAVVPFKIADCHLQIAEHLHHFVGGDAPILFAGE